MPPYTPMSPSEMNAWSCCVHTHRSDFVCVRARACDILGILVLALTDIQQKNDPGKNQMKSQKHSTVPFTQKMSRDPRSKNAAPPIATK